jgi:hypothetical protein
MKIIQKSYNQGVTHFCKGDLIFTPLEQWEVEQELYGGLQQIPFFKKYAKWKMYLVWKRAMIRQRILHCSNTLNNNLFILDDTLQRSLMRIRGLCVDM